MLRTLNPIVVETSNTWMDLFMRTKAKEDNSSVSCTLVGDRSTRQRGRASLGVVCVVMNLGKVLVSGVVNLKLVTIFIPSLPFVA